MTTIESEHKTINAGEETIYTFLTDMRNIKQLLPQDKISEWKADENSCSFKIQKAALIPLELEKSEAHNTIHYKSGEKAPFPFTLVVTIEQKDGQSEAHLTFNGEINAFLKMMVVKPLTNLFNYMANRLQEIHE